MNKNYYFLLCILTLFFAACAGTADKVLSSPQDARVLLDALPAEAAIDSTDALTSTGKNKLKKLIGNLKIIADPGQSNEEAKSHLRLSKVQKQLMAFIRRRDRDDWVIKSQIGVQSTQSCTSNCTSGFDGNLKTCNGLSGLAGATCAANNLTIHLLCLENCEDTVDK